MLLSAGAPVSAPRPAVRRRSDPRSDCNLRPGSSHRKGRLVRRQPPRPRALAVISSWLSFTRPYTQRHLAVSSPICGLWRAGDSRGTVSAVESLRVRRRPVLRPSALRNVVPLDRSDVRAAADDRADARGGAEARGGWCRDVLVSAGTPGLARRRAYRCARVPAQWADGRLAALAVLEHDDISAAAVRACAATARCFGRA